MSQSSSGNENSGYPEHSGPHSAGQPEQGGYGHSSWQSPGQPLSSSSWQQQAPPGSGTYAQTLGGDEGGKKSSTGLIIGIAAVVILVLIAGIVFLIFSLLTSDEEEEPGEDQAVSEGGEEDEEETPDGVDTTDPAALVEGYFAALADGDYATATGLWESVPDDSAISEEVLNYSLDLGPIENVEVSERTGAGETSTEVDATVTVDGQTAVFTVQLWKSYDSDHWQIQPTSVIDRVGLPDSTSPLSPTINGVEASGTVQVIAGLNYELAFSHEAYVFDGLDDGVVFADGGTDHFLSISDMTLSDEAVDSWRALIREAVEECVASTDLEAGCGLDLQAYQQGVELIDGTVERSMPTSTQEEINNLRPRFDTRQPHLVEADYFSGSVEVFVDGVENGVEDQYELLWGDGGSLGTPIVDLTQEAPEVIWE